MGRTDILICPNCDYKRHLTEAESRISGALVVACLKCGKAMQLNVGKPGVSVTSQPTFLEPCTVEAPDEWVVP